MSTPVIFLYVIAVTQVVGCGLLLLAVVDLHSMSSRHLQAALNLYETIIAEVAAEIDELATDIRLPDPHYAVLVSTVATITDPAHAGVVREAVYENGLVLEQAFNEGAAAFEASLDALTTHPDLKDRYAGIVVKSVRAASLWDLAFQGSRQPFLKVPAWATNPWRERDLIERSRYDEPLVRDILGRLGRLGAADRAPNPFRHAF